MLAYLIDPFARTVTAVEHAGGLQSIYRLTQCSCIDAIRLRDAGRDAVYCDDEGLLYDPATQAYAVIQQGASVMPAFLAGRGLLVGTDAHGNDCAPSLTLEQTRARIAWCEHDQGADIARMLVRGF